MLSQLSVDLELAKKSFIVLLPVSVEVLEGAATAASEPKVKPPPVEGATESLVEPPPNLNPPEEPKLIFTGDISLKNTVSKK